MDMTQQKVKSNGNNLEEIIKISVVVVYVGVY